MLSLLRYLTCAALYARVDNIHSSRRIPQIREPLPQLHELSLLDWLRNWLLLIIYESIHPLVLAFIITCAHDSDIVLEDTLLVFHSKLLAVRKLAWALQVSVR